MVDGFLEGREECLHSQLGWLYFSGLSQWIAKISNMFDISPTLHDSLYPDLGSALEIVLSWIFMACRLHFPSCPIVLLPYLKKNCHSVLVKYQGSTSRQAVETNEPFLKANWPVVKTESVQVFNRRVSNISTGQAWNHYNKNQHLTQMRRLLWTL